MKASWFVLQDPTYPADSLIRLGQLINDPRCPQERVGREPLEFGPGDIVHDLSPETNFIYTHYTHRRLDIGIGAAILSMLPFGVRGQYSASEGKLVEIERVESQILEPSDDYVQQTFTKPSVREYLAAKSNKKPLYMIVGLKVGRNAKIIQGRFNVTGGTISADIPGIVSGIPVDPRLDLSIGTSRFQGVIRQLPESFVFAYRLREVRYSIKVHLSRLGKTLTKGARLHSTTSSNLMVDADGSEQSEGEEIEYDGLSEQDAMEGIHCGKVVGGCMLVDCTFPNLPENVTSEREEFEEVEERVFLY